MDKLPMIHADGDCVPSRINLQVKRGDKGFGEATNFSKHNLSMTSQTLTYHAVAIRHMSYGKLQQNIKKIIGAVTLYSLPVSVTIELPVATSLAPCKRRNPR